MSTVLTNKCAR